MNFDERRQYNQRIKDVAYYLIVGVVSIIVVAFLPMIGSAVDAGFQWPQNAQEWAIWVVTRASIAVVNIMLFYCFLQQAKVNVKGEPHYEEANEILRKLAKKKELKPRNPKAFIRNQWLSKGITLFASSMLSVIVLADALLRFDMIQFLTYIFTIAMGVVFGYLTMRKNEDYWTSEYLAYAKMIEKEENEAEKAQEVPNQPNIEITTTREEKIYGNN